MTTVATDLPVTIVSADRALLRELSWTLSLFGYQVTASCDWSDESPWQRNSQPSLLLLDARANPEEADAVLSKSRSTTFTYRVVIGGADVAERLLLAGADDVIRYPVNTGELIARLRAGVRRLEFERRLAARRRHNAATGALTRAALLEAIESSGQAPTSTVTFGVDFLPLLRSQYGSHAIKSLTATLMRCVRQQLGEGQSVAHLSDSTFVALLNQPLEGADRFAEEVASAFASCDTLVREVRSLPSVSAAIAEWSPETPAAEQLESCEAIFEHVQSYGGGTIVRAVQVQEEIASWRNDMDAGVPFEDVVAQDMMELFPIILTQQQFASGYVAALPAGQKSSVPCIPVTDESGALVGAAPAGAFGPASPQMQAFKPQTVEFNQPLSELFEAFSAAQSEYLVVVDAERRPVGYVTCESLASLVLDRMNANAYHQHATRKDSVASLVVSVEPSRDDANQPVIAS